MPARSFFDTNVLAYTDDHDSPTEQSRALALFEEARRTGTGVVSTQVMQEYFVTVTRKLGVPVDVARRKVELFARLGLVVIDLACHRISSASGSYETSLNLAKQPGCYYGAGYDAPQDPV